MEVYALVGKSGTGKSYQAMNLCRDKDIEAIIDDGLFIYGNGILAGKSAKRQGTVVGAIKTALFSEEDHKNQVVGKLNEVKPNRILIIGTSDKMVEKIRKRLLLPPISETIYIESITTDKERQVANKQRHELGKHVIPVPTFQLKKDFSGYFLDPLRIFKKIGTGRSFMEKSVVRPTYSYLGDFFIEESAIFDIINILAEEAEAVARVTKVITKPGSNGMHITILVIMELGYNLVEKSRELQRLVKGTVADMTAFNIQRVDVEVRGIRS